ncbi:MAG: sulfotransferase family protein [Candidatus Natronoplasma sp.]
MVTTQSEKDLDRPYMEKLDEVTFTPIFVLGLPRSGTSILYKMLTETDCFNCVTSYHVIDYDRLIYNHLKGREEEAKKALDEEFEQVGVDDRGIDRLDITADFPEEYGYILGSELTEMYIKPNNIDKFTEMCKKIQFISEYERPILLKNPFDFQNIQYIKNEFPRSRFVFIARNPLDIIDSTFRAIRHLVKYKNPYSMRIFDHYRRLYQRPFRLKLLRFLFDNLPGLPLRAIIKAEEKATERFLQQVKKISEDAYIQVKYEELCCQPQRTMEEILDFLDCEPEEDMDFSAYIEPRDTPTEPPIKERKGYIRRRMRHYSEYFGYGSGEV